MEKFKRGPKEDLPLLVVVICSVLSVVAVLAWHDSVLSTPQARIDRLTELVRRPRGAPIYTVQECGGTADPHSVSRLVSSFYPRHRFWGSYSPEFWQSFLVNATTELLQPDAGLDWSTHQDILSTLVGVITANHRCGHLIRLPQVTPETAGAYLQQLEKITC